MKLITDRIFVLALALTTLVVSTWVYGLSVKKQQDLDARIQTEAQLTLKSTALSIDDLIQGLEKSIALFAQSNAANISHLITNPDIQSQTYLDLHSALQQHYPNMVAFTLADTEGNPILQHVPDLIGQPCKEDLHTFAETPNADFRRLHPNMFLQHFDIMASIETAGRDSIFFVNFHQSLISDVLAKYSTDALRFVLVQKDDARLIEFTQDGARGSIRRDPSLSDSEIQTIVGQVEIPRTRWLLLAMAIPEFMQEAQQAIQQDTFTQGLFAGGTGTFLLAGFTLYRRQALKVQRDLKQKHVELENMAHHDPLTGLPNRLLLHARLELTLERKRRDKGHAAILFLDLDGFKQINDQYGHRVGDKVLILVAEKLNRLRGTDTVARFAGDEFIAVLSDLSSAQDAESIAQKLIDDIRDMSSQASIPAEISTSIGIAIFPEHGEDVDSLIEHADQAMYQAKNAGKDCFRTFLSS